MRVELILLFFSLNFIFFSSFTFAQFEFYNEWIRGTFADFFGIPSEWLVVPTVIYNLIIPFIAIFAIALGFLRQIRIFANSPNIEMVLAFAMAFSTLPSRVFVQFVAFTLGLMGGYAYILFMVLFFVGSAFYSLARYWGWRGEVAVAKSYTHAVESYGIRLERIRNRISDLYRQAERPGADVNKITKEIDKLEKEAAEVYAKLKTIKQSY